MSRRMLAVAWVCLACAWESFAAAPAAPATQPATSATQPATTAATGRGRRGGRGAPTQPTGVLYQANGFSYYLDVSQAPELKEWAETKLRADIEKWYPIWIELMASDGFTAPKQFSITLSPNYSGVAATSGTRVTGNSAWFAGQLKNATWNEASGALMHELAHVVQQYGGYGRNPVWLVEGLTDYYRWFHFEPESRRPRLPNAQTAKYTDSYRVTAAFIEYVVKNYDHELAVRLNAAMRQGRYNPALWTEWTGKSIDELWADYVTWSVNSGNVGRGGGRPARGAATSTGPASTPHKDATALPRVMTGRTHPNNVVTNTPSGTLGPYVTAIPSNPLNDCSTVSDAAAANVGWVYQAVSTNVGGVTQWAYTLSATDTLGTTVLTY